MADEGEYWLIDKTLQNQVSEESALYIRSARGECRIGDFVADILVVVPEEVVKTTRSSRIASNLFAVVGVPNPLCP